ncbi:MAG: CopD family protein [Chitinophagaceae bacterium]
MYLYLKALHIIFIVTWFAGLFYIVRLFIYNTEAAGKPPPEKQVLQQQFTIMIRRLWLGITWPSAIITAILGPYLVFAGGWNNALFSEAGRWLLVKLIFVVGLYLYHFSAIYKQEMRGVFKYSSQKLRIWNEVATLFLVSIVMLATVKQSISFVWALIGLLAFIAVLMSAIRLYKMLRAK